MSRRIAAASSRSRRGIAPIISVVIVVALAATALGTSYLVLPRALGARASELSTAQCYECEGGVFAYVPHPVSVAATTSKLLATEWGNASIASISTEGAVSNFATVPLLDPNSTVNSIAISPGFGGFTRNAVFEIQGPYLLSISSNGAHVHEFAHLPGVPNGTSVPSGLTFDTVGSFGYQLVVTAANSIIDTVASNGTVTNLIDNGEACPSQCFFGPSIAPLNFAPSFPYDDVGPISLGGDIFVGQAGSPGNVLAISPQGYEVDFGNWTGASSVAFAPPSLCGFGNTGDPYFYADYSAGTINELPADLFTGGQGVIPESQAYVTGSYFENATPDGIGNISDFGGAADPFYTTSDSLWAQAFVSCPVFGEVVQIQHGNWYPYEMAYDPLDKDMYVTDNESNQAFFFNAKSVVIGQATVGTNSTGVAYDPANREMLVANSVSDNVSVFDAATNKVTGSIGVGADPQGIGYDPRTHDAYVANNGSNNLSVIAPDNQVIASVATGAEPFGVAYDAQNGYIYTANFGGTMTVVNGTQVVATIHLNGSATNLVQNFPTTKHGHMFATEYNVSTVARVGINHVLTYLPVGDEPFGIAYDPETQDLYVSNHGSGTLTILHGPTTVVETVVISPENGPWGVAYDPANGLVYIAGIIVGDPRSIGGGGG
jgi:YVTN family beta-propeller protein